MFNQSLSHALARAKRHCGRAAVMFLDLDRFKTINDTLGHEAGDAMLTGIAQRLRKVTREVGVVARLGCDEFVVLLEQFRDNDDLGLVAKRILQELDAPIDCAGHALHATASIGVSVCPEGGSDAESQLKCADIAMYRTKQEGRNTFRFCSASMSANSVERLSLENQLREAVAREEFLLHYQPKAELPGGRITGVEALIRWNNPVRGMMPPGEFIPLAEESGLILPIGRWALRTACLQGRAWQMEGLPQMRIAVNLSAYQLTPDLPAEFEAALNAAGIDAGWLEIEVTESMVMRNPGQSARILEGLRELGVHIAMDDFGNGYSSLGALKQLPLDTLKVDRSLVRDLPDDAGDNAICRAIIAMAHALKLKVVAEGVETEAQRDFLRGIGCDEIQGYLLSRPLPAVDVSAFIRAGNSSRLRLVSNAR
jgi:diguanylate cyclase (GGDEF)-like protein